MSKVKLERRPLFASMKDGQIKIYLQEYIKEKFKPHSRFMIKIPEHSKDDAVNEIFIDLWKNRYNYNPTIADFATYAYNRGRHVIKTVITQSYKTGRIRERIKERPRQYSSSSPSGYEIAEKNDDLEHALSRMTDEEKSVTQMRYYENKTVSEIANYKQCSPQKIYQILSGLKRLACT